MYIKAIIKSACVGVISMNLKLKLHTGLNSLSQREDILNMVIGLSGLSSLLFKLE